MRGRTAWVVLGLLVLAGGFWRLRGGHGPGRDNNTPSPAPANAPAATAFTGHPGTIATSVSNSANTLTPGEELKYRLSNTTKRADDLLRNDRAILLANAVIDTTRPLDALNIPDNLRAPADNGNWIVQANGPLGAPFRALLAGAGAQVISYIPNNAELVLAPANVAEQLRTSPLVASVVPYEPYYKLTDPALLKVAVTGADLPPDVGLRLGVFTGAQDATLAALKNLGADVVGSQPSPFGVTLDVHPANGTFIDVARLPGVMVVEAMHRRFSANDLSRMRLAASVNTTTNNDYLSLTGLGVFVNVNDSDVDQNNPDFTAGHITLDPTATGQDLNGHGTHVIGTILGNGSQSGSVGTNTPQGSATNASFRGMATNASAYVISLAFDPRPQGIAGVPLSDAYLQEAAGRTNVFISNNSWDYDGDASYDMAAASYDASVRDAVPEITGPQPLLYVFAAGNSGGGGTDGSGGIPDTILSPATAKNVITVGAIEQLRKITNTYVVHGSTNEPWLVETDNSNQVANFSSRGNVGVGIEGPSGRFKPDVVAPGTFVLSDKSAQWNQAAYYNPTNFTFNTQFNQSVTNNGLAAYSIVIPANAVSFTVSVLSNDFSPVPMPALPVYIGFSDNPTTNVGGFDAMGISNVTLTLTSTPQLPVGNRLFYSVGDQTNRFVSFNVQTLVETTNDNGNLLTVLSNMNVKLGAYRYESGTSMSAAGVSGILALMQEFLEKRLNLGTHSPALMKALLINGARTLGSQYDFNVNGAVISEGWGLPSLSNSIPGALTNGGANVPMQFFDQATNMLATGESKTRMLTLANGLGTQPLRVTLVWTDPPGNPAAGVKLVNDLDLIVSNLDNHTVFFGNDIPAGSAFNVTRSPTNNPTNFDSVNNVENVYLFPPLGTNYSITVLGRRVNVNAVDANTTNVVQDYALVVSYGDGGVFTNAFMINDTAAVVSSNNAGGLTFMTNGLPLLNQRVGGNSQFVWSPTTTNGITNQWKFYLFTNTPSLTNAAFTNVVFVTFDPPNLGVPRMGTREEGNPANGVRTEADVDLYVSTDPNLTNLTPAVMNAPTTSRSLGRTGTEKVLLTGQPAGQVYYAGVKSEDQQGAQFAFLAVALTNSLGQQDSNGNVTLTILAPALPTPIPTGTAPHPGSVTVLALTTVDLQARKVVVEDTIQHQEFGDLVGAVSHEQKSVVLNNHTFFDNPSAQVETFLYDDTGEVGDQFLLGPPFGLANPPPNSTTPRLSNGPGSLTEFAGDNISDGIWTFTMVNDSSPNDTGFINNLTLFVEPQQPTNGFLDTIAGDSWFYDFIDVPADATNLVITTGISTSGPVDIYLRRGAFPDANDFDKFALTPAPGGVMTLGLFDSPPLNPGRYFIGVFNPTPNPQTVNVRWTFGLTLAAPQPLRVVSIGNEPIPDDAVMDSTNHVGVSSRVVSTEVGVRINHPRESDLVLTLVSPSGTRVLLAENRGGLDNHGYGNGFITTNFTAPATNGSFAGDTNTINVGATSGTLVINYDMFGIPDDMRVYYGGARIFDSGLVSGAGNFSINFGPGASTSVTVVMNELGTNPNGTNGDEWTYQVSVISPGRGGFTYATFTEDTNKTTTPIKFAVPPFGGGAAFTTATTNVFSTFETSPAGDYFTTVDGWTVVDTNPVKVVSVNVLATNEGNVLPGANVKVLALHHGSILRVLPTIVGQSYTLSFMNHGRPVANGPVGWWTGNNTPNDSSGFGNNGTLVNGATYTNGEVAQTFNFNGNQNLDVPSSASLNPTQAITVEAWVNPSQTPNLFVAPIIKKSGAGGRLGYTMEYDFFGSPSDATVRFAVYTGTSFAVSPDSAVIPSNTWTHMAGTYDGAKVSFYVNGVLTGGASTPTSGPILNSAFNLEIAHDPDPSDSPPQRYFAGMVDETTIYSNALSQLQVQDIYAAGSAGKLPVTLSNAMVAANVVIAGVTNVITGVDQWTANVITFTAPSNNTVLEIQSLTNNDGMLVDSFQLVANPAPNTNNYYLPEETLDVLKGEPAQGDWKLEVLDNRLGATVPPPTLVSWQLSLGLERVNPAAQTLSNALPATNTVLPGFITYYVVDVPPWAQFATNILTVTSGGPASLLFNQGALPGLTNGDFTLIPTAPPGGTVTLGLATTPPLIPGTPYYLGVTNGGATAATFTLEVDFGTITPLINLTPVTGAILPIVTQPQYFYFDVPPATPAVSFLLYNLSGNVDLYVTKGFPLPTESSFNYDSINPGTNDDIITISSNSAPVPLSAGRWYLGVFNNDTSTNPVNYTIEAVILAPTIIPLTNDQRLTMTNVTPLASQETFFSFDITTAPAGALFEIYGMNGNVDLNLDSNTLPFAPAFFASSANSGTNAEQIVIRANTPPAGASLDGFWYLGAPSQASSNVTYTIHAVVTDTNGLLVSAVPIQPVVTLPVAPVTGPTLTWNTVTGECYDVYYSFDLINWTLLPIFPMPVNAGGTTISVTDPTPITGIPAKYYKIVQVVCP